MKIILTFILSSILLLSGCSSRNEPTNAYDEHRQTRDKQLHIHELYLEKEEHYTSDLRELTFEGNPEDLNNIVLTVQSEVTTMGLPRYYKFIEKNGTLQVEVHIIEELEGYPGTYEDTIELLTVDSIDFQEGIYTVNAEEYTFHLHMFQESKRRLRDESGAMLLPSHYIPEEQQEQWLREAEEEVNN